MAIVFDEIVGHVQQPDQDRGGSAAPAGGQGQQPQELPLEALRKDLHRLEVRLSRVRAD